MYENFPHNANEGLSQFVRSNSSSQNICYWSFTANRRLRPRFSQYCLKLLALVPRKTFCVYLNTTDVPTVNDFV